MEQDGTNLVFTWNEIRTKMNRSRTGEFIMLRTVLQTAAEITSLLAFGSMVAMWAMILAPVA
jgi:hypothetical protein